MCIIHKVTHETPKVLYKFGVHAHRNGCSEHGDARGSNDDDD